MGAQGSATINFGAFPGLYEASVVVSAGVGAILSGSHVEAFLMAETSSVYTAIDHSWAALLMDLTCGAITPSTNFTIFAKSNYPMQGIFTLRWVWNG